MRITIRRPRRAVVLAALLGTLPALGLIQLPDAAGASRAPGASDGGSTAAANASAAIAAKPYMGWSSWSLESTTAPGVNAAGQGGSLTEAEVIANGGPETTIQAPGTGGWNTVGTLTITVPLQAGANTITFTGPDSNTYSPDVDRIML